MKIYVWKRKVLEILSIVLGITLSLFLVSISDIFFIDAKIPMELIFLISFLCGTFILNAIGMAFEKDSRVGGLLIASISVPLLIFFSSKGSINMEGFAAGLVIGFLIDLYAVLRNRFDALASLSRIFITAFFIILLSYISYGFAIRFLYLTQADWYKFIITVILVITLYIILKRVIRGIKASDVFVFGPTRSGKTYFLLALYNYVVNTLRGYAEEAVISPYGEEREKEMEIASMVGKTLKGELVQGTRRHEIGLYILKGKRRGVTPVDVTVIDYGGEMIPKINEKNYAEAIGKIRKTLEIKGDEIGLVGSIEFLKFLKEKHSDKYNAIVEDLTLAYLYKKLKDAGKIILLVDGEKIANWEEGIGELAELFGHYQRIISMFGVNKKYAIVVTKTDMIEGNLTEKMDEREIEEIERKVYDRLYNEIPTFKALVFKGGEAASLEFYTVSARAIPNDPRINEWGVDRIERFIF